MTDIPIVLIRRRRRLVGLITLATCAMAVTDRAPGAPPPPERADASSAAAPQAASFFETQVLPILRKNCYPCHGAEGKTRGGLDLTSRRAVLRGGDSGPAVDLDSPLSSLLLDAVNYESYEMPPSGKLPDDQIRLLVRWVQMGAPWFPGEPCPPENPPHDAKNDVATIPAEVRAHWAFQPLVRPQVPELERGDGVRNPIDAFVLARLEATGLPPAERATPQALIRRAYYDLIGLPPSPDQVTQFVTDDSPQAFERVVDQLLQSPHYGEKWGRHWLDLVRYAESNSYERDDAKPHVWRYRDYVIQALNSDKPYDRFVMEQLAGDELEDRTPESLTATGYYRLGLWDDEPIDQDQALYDGLDDIVKTTSQVFLGLTMDCARCHDHKLDPLPQEDYYRFLAFFQGVNPYGTRGGGSVVRNSVRPLGTPEQVQRHEDVATAYQARLRTIDRRIAQIEKEIKRDFEPVEHEDFKYQQNRVALVRKRAGRVISEQEADEYERLTEERRRLKREPPPSLSQALCVTESGATARPTHVLIRGNAHVPGNRVEPGYPQVLGFLDPAIPVPPSGASTCARRSVLARWIASPENPLTARVMANRLWQYHFGRGIVRSSNNFGLHGDRPTHPQLLDWLATELIRGGWRLKRLHRLIMDSNTYQMSSRITARGYVADPQNDLWGRFDMRRLTAEEIRDSILAVSRSLNTTMGGPSIYTTISEEVLAGQSRPGNGWPTSSPEAQRRRCVYIHVKRSLRPPLLEVFDAVDTDATCPVRFTTTQPTQALTMLNGWFIAGMADALAADLLSTSGDGWEERVETALWRALQREPTNQETDRGVQLTRWMRQNQGLNEREALANYCLVVLNLNEFLYLD